MMINPPPGTYTKFTPPDLIRLRYLILDIMAWNFQDMILIIGSLDIIYEAQQLCMINPADQHH